MKKYLMLFILLILPVATATTLEELIPNINAGNSVLVAGEKADAMDWLGAAKVATTFSAAAAQTIETETTTETTDEDKHNFQAHLTESISRGKALSKSYLSILEDGVLQARNFAIAKQYLTISEDAAIQYTKSSENNDKVGDYLVFEDDEAAYTYRIDFSPRANSERDGNDGIDFIGENLDILGREYRVVDASVTGAGFKLRMLSGDIKDSLEEGQTKTYTVDGATITVAVDLITSGENRVKMTINSNQMDVMRQNNIYAIPGSSMYIGIGDILENEAGETGAGRDMVGFYLGADLLELEDDDISDADFLSEGVTHNSKRIDDSYVKMVGEITTNDIYISTMSVEWRPDSEIEVPLGAGLASYASEGQIFGSTDSHKSFDVFFDSEVSGDKETIEINSNSNSEYRLYFDAFRNDYSFTVYELAGNNAIQTKVKSTEGDTATTNDMIVFSEDKDTVVARVGEITVDAAGNGEIKLKDLGGSANTYTISNHVATVTFHGHTYTLTEQNVGAQVVLTDINGDGLEGGTSSIWTKYGAEIRVGRDRNDNAIDGITFLEHEDGKEESSQRGSTEVLFNEVNNVLLAQTPTFTDNSAISFNSYGSKDYARTLWGTLVTVDDLDGQSDVKIFYPENEVNFNVDLIGGERKEVVSTTTTPAVSEWSILSDSISDNRNLVIIGGPCANAVAANLLETGDKCNDGFVENESMIKLVDLRTGHYAIIIAGWEKEDTADAVYVFNNYADYPNLKGIEVKLRGKTII